MSGPAAPIPPARRWLALATLVLSIGAATLFVVAVALGSGGAPEVTRLFSPIAVAATGLGLVAAFAVLRDRRLRTIAVVSLAILAPCVLLSALTLIAFVS